MTVKLQLATCSGLYGIHRQGQGFISTMSLERRDYAPVPKQKKKEKKRKEKKKSISATPNGDPVLDIPIALTNCMRSFRLPVCSTLKSVVGRPPL